MAGDWRVREALILWGNETPTSLKGFAPRLPALHFFLFRPHHSGRGPGGSGPVPPVVLD